MGAVVSAVEFFAYVFVGLGGVVIPPASGNGESREAQSGHEPQQYYDNQAAHGQGLRCLHCKYNNNVHTRKENRQESDGSGRKSMMQPAAPRCGQVAQVDRFMADVVEKDTIHIHQKKPRCTNCNGKGTIRCGICYDSCTRTCGRCNCYCQSA